MKPFSTYIKEIITAFLILPFFITVCIPAFSQQNNQGNSQGTYENAQQKIQSLKMAYLTQQLDLSPKQAQKFWPVYNQYQQEMQQINRERRQNTQERNNLKNPTDQQIEQSLNRDFQLRQQALQLRENYRKQFRNVIPPRKVSKLYQSEREFNMKLIQELRRRQNAEMGGGNQQAIEQEQQMERQAERRAQQQQMRQQQRIEHQMQQRIRPPKIHIGR